MKILNSFWVLGILGMFINVGAFVYVMMPITKEVKKIKIAKNEKTSGSSINKNAFWSFRTKEIENLTSSLQQQIKILIKKEKDLTQEEEGIKREKEELLQFKSEIELLGKELMARIVTVEESELKNLRNLATAYSKIPPEDVIKVLNEMDDLITIKILALMKPDTLGSIFQQMATSTDPSTVKKAAYLSEKLRLYNIEKSKK